MQPAFVKFWDTKIGEVIDRAYSAMELDWRFLVMEFDPNNPGKMYSVKRSDVVGIGYQKYEDLARNMAAKLGS